MDIGPIKRVWEVEPVEAPAEPAWVEPGPAEPDRGEPTEPREPAEPVEPAEPSPEREPVPTAPGPPPD
jgi:hypothetical protein